MPDRSIVVREVVRAIDRGGFGRVEEVVLEDGRRLARKTFDPRPEVAQDTEVCEKARERFIREVRMQAGINHPNVVPIVHAELSADPLWFLMPLASRSLKSQVEDDRRAGAVTLAPLTEMLDGLEELHRLGFVHRDLKPANVLLVDGHWMVSDFGLVLPPSGAASSLTGPSSVWMTKLYAAPEVLRGFHSVTAAADIYSVGCILHDCVTDAQRVPHARCTHSGSLGAVIEKCTEQRPEDRFRDVAALRSAIVMVLGDTTPAAGPRVSAWVTQLEGAPGDIAQDRWAEILRFLDHDPPTADRDALLNAVDSPQIEACHANAELEFPRLAAVVSRWVKLGSFNFEFCDVLGSRLARIVALGGTREKAEGLLAMFHLSYSHNRWSIMRLFFRLASPSLSQDVAERVGIEILALGWTAELMLGQMESAIGYSRASLHPLLQAAFARLEQPAEPAF